MEYDADFKLFEMISTESGMKMFGEIFNDSKNRFDDGEFVRTSSVDRILHEGGTMFVITANTTYRIIGFV